MKDKNRDMSPHSKEIKEMKISMSIKLHFHVLLISPYAELNSLSFNTRLSHQTYRGIEKKYDNEENHVYVVSKLHRRTKL